MMVDTNIDASIFSDSSQENSRKLFVGGLSWETTSDNLRAYMSRYGEVVDCSVKIDVSTGRSRGFGFVMFKTSEEADTVLKTRPHMLDGKIIDPKKAVGITKTGLPVTKKIFVGGVRSETSDDILKDYFSQFGSVHSLDFPIDHTSSKRRGFCFLEFDEPDAAEKAMSMNFHPIGNQTVEVKPAYTKEQQQALMARGMWPPQNGGSKSSQMMFNMENIQSIDLNSQNALKSIIAQTVVSGGATNEPMVSTTNGQMSQIAATALFYQTYLQYAMALNVASLVQTTPNDSEILSNPQIAIDNKIEDNLNKNQKRSSENTRQKFSPKKRSPRKDFKDDSRRRRRRSSSEFNRRRRNRSRSGNRPNRR